MDPTPSMNHATDHATDHASDRDPDAPPSQAPAQPRRDAPPPLVAELFALEPQPKRLGEILVDLGHVEPAAVEDALQAQATDPRPIGEILVSRGVCPPEAIEQALHAQQVMASPLWRHLGKFRWKDGLAITQLNETHRQAVILSLGDRHVQLTPEEYHLALGLVSEPSFGAIARRCWEATGHLAVPEQVLTLTTRLWMLGLLSMNPSSDSDPTSDSSSAETPANPPALDTSLPEADAAPRRSGWARWLQLRIPFHDPTRMLDLTAPIGRWMFSRQGLTLALALWVAAAVLMGFNAQTVWTLIVSNLTHRWVGGLGCFMLAYLCCSTVHEYGHAMACRAFGGSVRRMGVMLYLFIPMAYCDVSDAHRFPEKWKRLVTSAAGIYFQLCLASVAAIAWEVLTLPTSVELILAQIVAITLVATLANLNPLLKLDGYYMLADWLEIPNLRPRAFAYLDQRARLKPVSGNPRELQAFLWYGLLGGAYTLLFVGYFTWRAAHWLFHAWLTG